jgi:hypothetical protein
LFPGFRLPASSFRVPAFRFRLRCPRLAALASRGVLDHAQYFAHLDVRAVTVRDLREHARLRCRDLEIDLVGLELDEGLADIDGVPFFFQPLRHPGIDDRLTDFGNDYVCRHPDSLSCLLARLPTRSVEGTKFRRNSLVVKAPSTLRQLRAFDETY